MSWYVQAVYDQGCYDDAIETLGVGENLKMVKKLGPRDTARIDKLAELDRILPKSQEKGYDDEYVSGLLEAAKITRGLEYSQQEVYGRFTVALEAAKKYGLPQQVFECIYQKAWTDFYWYEKPDAAYENYCELKRMLDIEINITRIERLFTLFQVLFTYSNLDMFKEPINITQEYEFFEELYRKMEVNPNYSSSTLYLKICLLEFELIQKAPITENYDGDRIDAVITELMTLIKQASFHIDICFDLQSDILMTIGQFYDSNKLFDNLVDTIADIQASRNKDISAATIQYQRGLQNIDSNNYEDAIRHLSRCFVLYQKESSLTELIRTSGLLAQSYAQVDLLYCAKTYYVKAASLLFVTMGNEGRSNHLLITILLELCELELNLGQFTSFLEWLSLLDGFVATLPNYLDKDFISARTRLDAILGSLIYKTPLNDEAFAIMPDILERHQLDFSRNVLLIKMGKTDMVSKDFQFLLETQDYMKSNIMI